MTLLVMQNVKSINVKPLDRSGPQDFYKTLIVTDTDGKEFQIMFSSRSKDALELNSGMQS